MTKTPTEVVLTKELDAPRELVFEAFTRAEHVEKWIAPDGFTAQCVVEFRKGGGRGSRVGTPSRLRSRR